MNIQELKKLVSNVETISQESLKRFFFMLKENDKKTEEYLNFLVNKDADFISKFIDAVEQQTKKENRVLMTFKSRNEMNDFIKAGNKCGSSWYENDLIQCYCYEFVKSVEKFKTKQELKEKTKIKTKQEEKPKEQKKYVQQEIEGIPKKRGGWRGGGRPKTTGQTTIAIRIDKRLEKKVNELKKNLKNGIIEKKEIIKIEDIKKLLEKTKKEHEERYFRSIGEEKAKHYAMATAITHFDIILDNFIKNNC